MYDDDGLAAWGRRGNVTGRRGGFGSRGSRGRSGSRGSLSSRARRGGRRRGLGDAQMAAMHIAGLGGLGANPFDVALNGNPFDIALSGIDEEGLGFLKKIKKAVKKVTKSATKAVKKAVKQTTKAVTKAGKQVIDLHKDAAKYILNPVKQFEDAKRKLLPDSVEKKVDQVVASDAFKVAAVGAAAFFGGPAIMGALGSAGVTMPTMASVGSFVAKTGGTILAQQYVGGKLAEKEMKAAEKLAAKAEAQAGAELEAELRSIVDDPAFVAMAKTMLEQGYSVDQIIETWMQSDAYKAAATVGANNALVQSYYDELMAAGANESDAWEMAEQLAAQQAVDAAQYVQNQAKAKGNNVGGLLLLAAPFVLSVMGK